MQKNAKKIQVTEYASNFNKANSIFKQDDKKDSAYLDTFRNV